MSIDITTLALPPAWMERALCAQIDLDGFFPLKGADSKGAKKVCGMCPVQRQCLAFAVEHEEPHGIWGGLSAKQRRPLIEANRATQVACQLEGCDGVVDRLLNPRRRYCSDKCAARASTIRFEQRNRAS